ncbi:hypothetical protein [Legionella israelensis]|uniref:Uncharacterized protein n=1 Tax=Legionella israelensis TaxID=454 RepID=A0A0W0WS65_9GAMM|nr:hypothetical protein [Legionella israelensis]KTD35155.1 hypothetical protein Lisr_0047 [Legionella israelensis]QBS08692.1 hypothetical protein E4T55_01755 [Legionella israelensis]SCY00865.1 hypothetical protein SAMN02746069_00971 [Legionella israelensis DSM 19235]STX58360.1 Uncharacterised protein [Legionella israelensis]
MNFYINEKTKVIRKFPGGKYYKNTLSASGVKELEKNLPEGSSLALTYIKDGRFIQLSESNTSRYQSAQRGGTCWYSAFKHTFYGPFFSGPQRDIEKIISDYHKECTGLTLIKAEEDAFVDWFNEQMDDENESRDRLLASFLLKNSSTLREAPRKLLQDFIDSNEVDLTYFAMNRQGRALMDAIKTVSRRLHFNVESAVWEAVKRNGIPSTLDLSSDELSSYYDRAIIKHIWSYDYTDSSWHPVKGLQALIEEIRQASLLAEIDYNLVKVGTGQPALHFTENGEDGYSIFNVMKTEEEEAGEETHVIKIIGAERMQEDGYVYFIDPNDASAPHEPRVIHKISYSLFCHVLLDEHGLSVNKSMAAELFPTVLYRAKKEDTDVVMPASPRRSKRLLSPKIDSKQAPLADNEDQKAHEIKNKKQKFEEFQSYKPSL